MPPVSLAAVPLALLPVLPIVAPMQQLCRACVLSKAICEALEGHAEGYVPGGFVSSERERQEQAEHTNNEDEAEVEATVSAIEAEENLFEFWGQGDIQRSKKYHPQTHHTDKVT